MHSIEYHQSFLTIVTLIFWSCTMQCSSYVLITSLYNETNQSRAQEYIACIERNLQHPLISHIHIIYDTGRETKTDSIILDYITKKPITITYRHGRPTFQYCIDLANQLYTKSAIILTNADIYFNETLSLLSQLDLTGKFLALTRWNVLADGTLEPFYRTKGGRPNISSQDTWIFLTPCTAITNAHIDLGTMYCDGKIAYIAKQAGLLVYNPCKSIQCCHIHLTGIRHYKIAHPPGRIAQTSWCSIEDIPSTR